MRRKRKILLLGSIVLAVAVCIFFLPGKNVMPTPKESREWSVSFKRLGTLSSPRLADLNQDGVLA